MDTIYGDLDARHSMGTAIIDVAYDGGVVFGVDSRTSTAEITQMYTFAALVRGLAASRHLYSVFRRITFLQVYYVYTINRGRVARKFYSGDTLEAKDSLLDTSSAASPQPMLA